MPSVSIHGVAAAKRHLKAVSEALGEEPRTAVAEQIASHGKPTAVSMFADNLYAGSEPDVNVSVETLGHGRAALVATGPKVLFIEFGSGTNEINPGNPAGARLGFTPGSFTTGHIRPSGWWMYRGEPGHGKSGLNLTAVEYTQGKRKGMVKAGYWWTQGNPPANAMYEAGKEMHRVALAAVKRMVHAR